MYKRQQNSENSKVQYLSAFNRDEKQATLKVLWKKHEGNRHMTEEQNINSKEEKKFRSWYIMYSMVFKYIHLRGIPSLTNTLKIKML